jgi:hypothetical protein
MQKQRDPFRLYPDAENESLIERKVKREAPNTLMQIFYTLILVMLIFAYQHRSKQAVIAENERLKQTIAEQPKPEPPPDCSQLAEELRQLKERPPIIAPPVPVNKPKRQEKPKVNGMNYANTTHPSGGD